MSEISIDSLVSSKVKKAVSFLRNDDGTATVFVREGGEVKTVEVEYKNWILLADETVVTGYGGEIYLEKLEGNQFFGQLATFPNEKEYTSALKFLKTSTGFSPSSAMAPYRVVSDLDQQFLTMSGIRLFSGMQLDELLRMQIDIEVRTTPGYSFPNSEREFDAIIMIAMRDSSGWEKLLSLDEISEKEILQEMVELINERNPDVIEGHNIFNFDLPYIEARAKRHKVKLNIGRDGSKAKSRKSRFNVAERTLDYMRYDIAGRHVIDTFHLVQLYDVIKREFDSYGLKYIAKYFGVSAPERTYVEGDKISELFEQNPDLLKKYAMDDVRETDAISKILSPSFFYQAQIIPMTYQNCLVRGNATRIESIFTSAYLDAKHSIPKAEPAQQVTGGLTASFHDGIFENVWHADVRSLYPSIIMAEKISPSRDQLGIFQCYLGKLRTFRLESKDLMNSATNQSEKDHYSALQSTFKILINSFYGYLGFGFGSFNDYEAAGQVTRRGREILTSMENLLTSIGSKVIEMDTDGLYFQPPEGFSGTTDDMQKQIQTVLPEGIEVELDAVYKAMFGYKSKNYALLHEDGKISLAGGALKSRGLEPFQRDFMRKTISLLLHRKSDEILKLYDSFCEKIRNHSMPLAEFVKTETLARSVKAYQDKLATGKGRRAAAYELAAIAEQDFRQGDQIKFYVTGDKKRVSVVENSKLYDPKAEVRDENVAYYLAKIEELFKKFDKYVETTDNQLTLF